MNDHVAGVARELRRLGHTVTVLAPSNRAVDLREGRRALQSGRLGDVVAIGPALPVSRRSTMAAPVGVRANLALALAHGAFDVVHGFEPGLPSLSYLALRDTHALAVAAFFSPDRLFFPPGKAQRARLLGRIDLLLATSKETADAAAERFPGDYTVISPGVDRRLFRPDRKQRSIVVELVAGEREAARTAIRSLDERDGWEVVLLRESALAGKPYVPLRLRGRVHVRTQPSTDERAALLNAANEFVPAPGGSERLALEATASAGDGAPSDGFAEVAGRLDQLYRRLAGRRREIHVDADPLSDRKWIAVDLHTHTSWSHDCSVPATDLLDVAEEIGLGAIAVTEHNVFGGAQEAAELARGRALTVIPGEEMKTKGQGEVIGLFLREIPRGLSSRTRSPPSGPRAASSSSLTHSTAATLSPIP